MPFDNLPGIFDIRSDGLLSVTTINPNPVICIIGTAGSGDTGSLFTVGRISDAARTYGRLGTLTRGLFEVTGAGGVNVRLFRIGATSAVLANIGGGLRIETIRRDASAGTDYTLFWEATPTLRLRVFRADNDVVVFDNNPVTPSAAVDLGEVVVTGAPAGAVAGNIGTLVGTLAVPKLTLAAANAVAGAVFTAGTDGLGLSRMRIWEELYNAYRLLENEALDVIVPMDVYLDDRNITDLTNAEVTPLGLAQVNAYPVTNSDQDLLYEVFVQEFQGRNYFWWDTDRDGLADIVPVIPGNTNPAPAVDAFGNALVAADFHDVNFGYQLARFCFDQSQDSQEMLGFIGTRPPRSFALADVAIWVGRPHTTALNAAGQRVITTNGTGLLGNKWMAGRLTGAGASAGLPGHTVDGVDGLFGGGFIATDTQYSDGVQQRDRNNRLVDLGKYLNVVPSPSIWTNPWQDASYVSNAAPSYAGFVTSLAANSAPTNKRLPGSRLPFRINNARLDLLAGRGYVMLQDKPKGTVVADAPTASRDSSDYRRLTTMRIVKATIDAIRSAAEPFLGESISGARLAALETALEQVLAKLVKAGFLQRFEHTVTSTPAQQVQGRANVELKLVPAFELRMITVFVSLAAE